MRRVQAIILAAALALLAAPAAAFVPLAASRLPGVSRAGTPLGLRPARLLPARSQLRRVQMQAAQEGADLYADAAPPAGDGAAEHAVVVAKADAAIATGPPAQQSAQQQYYEEQPAAPAQVQGELAMPKEGVNTMVLVGGSLAAVAGGYYGIKAYKARQELLVEEFGYSAMLYWGDVQGSVVNTKEYLGRIGPVINRFHRADMFKSYVKRLASDKPLGAVSLNDFRAAAKRVGVSRGAAHKCIQQAAEELVPHTDPKEPWERDANKPSVLGKLLWLTERCYPDAATLAKIRTRFPRSYGEEVIGILQRTLTEQAYKDVLEANGGPENGLQPGYEELGLAKADAEALIEQILKEKAEAAAEAARIAAEKAEEARVQAIRDAAYEAQKNKNQGKIKTHGEEAPKKDEDDGDKVTRASGTHEYECTNCGYTLFVAKGREFKFFGDNFRCAGCGAGKDKFKDNALADN